MATITKNPDSTLTLTLSDVEQDTFESIEAGKLESYLSLWLAEQSKQVFVTRFGDLSEEEKSQVMQRLRPRRP